MSGTGNINSDPIFVNTPPTGYFFLSQIAAGQTQNSPCVNAGDPASPMITGSTRTDYVQDAGVVDMGFHWAGSLDQLAFLQELLTDESKPTEQTFENALPECHKLQIANHPNPFNPATTITLQMDEAAPVDLSVFDASGRVITTLHRGFLEAGTYSFAFSGASLPTGVYIYRAEIAGRIVTGKALLMK